jgi:anti-sigma factor RsiW
MCADTPSVSVHPKRVAELEAEVERLRAENVALHSSIVSRERFIDRLRAAASPVAVNPAEDAFLNQCEPGEVRHG